jgi:hypothetical protein
MQSNDEEELAVYTRRLNEFLRPSVFSHPKAAELFTLQGRLSMEALGGQRGLHVHWDNKTRVILLYGKREAIEAGQHQLAAEAMRLSELMQKTVPIPLRDRNSVNAMIKLADLRSLEGMEELQWRGSRGYVLLSQYTNFKSGVTSHGPTALDLQAHQIDRNACQKFFPTLLIL